ncbi:MAG: universal stress protein [Polaromonas sp.]|nr:universal stress protein [Polaromonas sp.]
MKPQSILAITDFSANTHAVLDRAMQLALAHGATLELMYAPPEGTPSLPDAAWRLSQHAFQLRQRHQASPDIASRTASSFRDIVSAALKVDLVVIGAASERDMKSLFCGLPEERLLRATRRPVLVVRKGAEAVRSPYSHLLVAVDFSEASRHLVQTAFAFGESARIELFHALGTLNEGKLRAYAVSEEIIQAYRQQNTRFAREQMVGLSDSTLARRNRVASRIGHGDPAVQAVVQQQYSGAELIVVGKHPAYAISDFLVGSVSQRVLQHATADVLVVPHGYKPGTRAAAVQRFAHNPPARQRIRAGAPLSPG